MTDTEPVATHVVVNAKSSSDALTNDDPLQTTSVTVGVDGSKKSPSPIPSFRKAQMDDSNGFSKSSSSLAEPLQLIFKDIFLSLRSSQQPEATNKKSHNNHNNNNNDNSEKKNAASTNEKVILNNCTGVFEPGRICAVLGASGAGKTSLIQLISGHRTWPSASIVQSSGKILINGEEAGEDRLRQLCAFVYQDDIMYESLTVREIITLAAMLRLPQSLSDDEKKERVESVIDMLALRRCAETRVGASGTSGGVGGISGGEKRRLSMAIEMINNPSILFLDEPTSGLDTYTAYTIVRILKSIAAKYNRTIVFTIHQPSSDIYHLFDDIMLLANGRMVYQGDAQKVVDYVGRYGYHCPEYVNIADYLFMNVLYDYKNLKSEVFSNKSVPSTDAETAQKDEERKKLTESERKRINHLLDAWIESEEYQSILNHRINNSPYKSGIPKTIQTSQAQAKFSTQFKLLTERVIKNLMRNRLALRASAGQMIFFAVFTGLIYLQIAKNQGGVQDRMGSLFFFAVQGVMGAMSMNLATFSVERDIFLREFNSGMYTLPAFFSSRVLAEIPFRIIFVFIYTAISYWMIGYQATFEKFITFYFLVLGIDFCGQNMGKAIATAFPNINVALAIGPAMMLPMMLFSGLYINLNKIPQYFRWMSYLSPMRWGYVGLSRLEFPGLEFYCNPKEICRYQVGDQVLKAMGFDDQPDPWYCVLILFSFTIYFFGLAYYMLYRGTRKLA